MKDDEALREQTYINYCEERLAKAEAEAKAWRELVAELKEINEPTRKL